MIPHHHLDPEELLDYATGAAPEWASLLAACHLTLCEQCRRDVRLYEQVGGALLGSLEPADAPPPSLERIVATERVPDDAPSVVEPSPITREAGLPVVIEPYFKEANPRWRFSAPRVAQIPLKLSVNDCPMFVVRFSPGYRVPEHTHTARETLLLFAGTITDGTTGEHFYPGDVYRSERGFKHDQYVGRDEPCISLVVNEGRVRPSSWIGRVLARLAGV